MLIAYINISQQLHKNSKTEIYLDDGLKFLNLDHLFQSSILDRSSKCWCLYYANHQNLSRSASTCTSPAHASMYAPQLCSLIKENGDSIRRGKQRDTSGFWGTCGSPDLINAAASCPRGPSGNRPRVERGTSGFSSKYSNWVKNGERMCVKEWGHKLSWVGF